MALAPLEPKRNEALVPSTLEHNRKCLEAALCVTKKTNSDLTAAQKELLKLHFRLGHIGFRHI